MESRGKSQQITNLSPVDLPKPQHGLVIPLAMSKPLGACSEVLKYFDHCVHLKVFS